MKVLAADVGGTSLRAALVEDDGKILARRAGATPQDPDEGVALLRAFWNELGPAAAAALVVAGGIRSRDGEITQSPNLRRWEGTRPGHALGCEVLNDANGALLGEAWLGALRARRSALLLTLGTGVGGAVLCDGELWTGSTGCAGEIGHVPVKESHLERYASARAVARAAGTADARAAADAARQGDARAAAAFEQAGAALGIVLAGLVNVFNPEAICLGGGMAAALDLFQGPLQAELSARAFKLALEGLEIVPAALGGDAGLLGAARAALRSIKE
ncbi:MAG: ROK family protein [Planctomycetota bacterium]|jgi:glucokinase